MRTFILIIPLITMLAVVTACSGDDGKSSSDALLTVTPSEVVFSAEGGTQAVSVACSDGQWTAYAANNADWVTVSASGTSATAGTVSLTAQPNNGMRTRQTVVTIQAGAAKQQLLVRQEAGEALGIAGPEGYTLVWHDEFNSGHVPTTGSYGWWYETGDNGWGNHELQYYVEGTNHPDVCFIENGILNIRLQRSGTQIQSIRMNTEQAWQYGWFEARLRLPAGRGTWPAFWMMPKNFTSWPADGEIDIMEEVGYNPNYVLATIHCSKYNNGGTSVESAGRSVPTAQTDFHVYACEWTADRLSFYIDGQHLLTYRNDRTGHDQWPFDAPFYLKLNLAWGGDWGGAQGIDESCLPATYQVDYVRVFQKE